MWKSYKIPKKSVCKHNYLEGHCKDCTIEQLQAENEKLRDALKSCRLLAGGTWNADKIKELVDQALEGRE